MQYRTDRYGNQLSVLGFGCMRFTRKGPGIDLEKAKREVALAIERGVNYFDTAYIYPGSEAAVGQILEELGARDKVNIATKLPHYLMKSVRQMEDTFNEELSRLRTDHIDYYLLHMVTDLGSLQKFEAMGGWDWVMEKKTSGAIRQLGFSFHGSQEEFLKVLEAHDWDFCQIQYNYMDENAQAGRRGLQAAAKKGIPVIIMEPLRGGRLISLLPPEAKARIAADPEKRSAAELALRWLYDQPEVTVVLSGMNSAEMVEENCRVAEKTLPGSVPAEEHALIAEVRDLINARLKVGCTGCSYCMPCPHGVDIPTAFRCYNMASTEGVKSGRTDYFRSTILRHTATSASLCVECGACERHCPQSIEIRKELKNAVKTLETPYYRVARKAVSILKIW